MRENNKDILFRGKRLDTNGWDIGSVLFHDTDKAAIIYQHPRTGSLRFHEVNPDTIGRYFCRDKIGGYIFDGDIVNFESMFFCQTVLIQYEDGRIIGKSLEKRADKDVPLLFTCKYLTEHGRVIGNCYDNPELLPQLEKTEEYESVDYMETEHEF